MAALQNIPSPSNRLFWISLAATTLAATAALDSVRLRSTSLRGSIGRRNSCMSIQMSD